MSRLDHETKRKLREMGATALLEAFEAQDDTLTLQMSFEERIQVAVDDAHASFNTAKVEGLIRRAGLRYPDADLRTLALIDERGLDRAKLIQLSTCGFIERHHNVVFQGFTGSGKSYLGSALAKAAASTATAPTTSGCLTLKNHGPKPKTNQEDERSGCASTPRSTSSS